MERPRSLAVVTLGLACLFVTACQTAGTPPQSQAAGQAQASSQAGAQPQDSSQAGAPASPQAAGRSLAPGAKSASANRAALPSRDGRTVGSGLRELRGGTVELLGKLYSAVTGRKMRASTALEWAVVAAILIVAVGAVFVVRAVRHRKLTPSSLKARG